MDLPAVRLDDVCTPSLWSVGSILSHSPKFVIFEDDAQQVHLTQPNNARSTLTHPITLLLVMG